MAGLTPHVTALQLALQKEQDKAELEEEWDYLPPAPWRVEVLGMLAQAVTEASNLAGFYDTAFVNLPAAPVRCKMCGKEVSPLWIFEKQK